ncbi:LysR family transcriptional regulator [Rhizobium sp. YJ-22]|uniref:LysR family transcriptional regulator n=1 Tax=Rhizobium sp. YJ-22 TaxID=3037556 RepID=UPI00241295A8|nr:LysR family transcriptional regulator [Rhizobium sp. YJ-22]MDG3576070.1 LysR family transcriptional regulator [Rhizobium sp. YJ-22]
MATDLSNWDWYRTFLAVLEEGSLSAAARALGLTQPTAGRHIEALERHLGLPLFTRSQQGLLPTEAARRLQPQAKLMATTAASLMRMASGERDGISGTVRISASDVVGVEVLPPILAALQGEHPGLTVELSLSDKIEDLLRREADIAVRMTAPRQEVLLVRTVGPVALGLHARRDYLDRHGMPETPNDLARHRLIGFDRETAFIRAAMDALPMLSGLSFAFRSDNNLAQLAAIRAGMGIGLCQVPLARREPDLVRLFAKEIDLPLETHVVMHEDMKSARRCRLVFDALVQGLKTFIAS